MSARKAIVGPGKRAAKQAGDASDRNACFHFHPSERSRFATTSAVRTSRLLSSGCW